MRMEYQNTFVNICVPYYIFKKKTCFILLTHLQERIF